MYGDGLKSVLVVVFDGLQPAQVTPELMPNLAAFAAAGVTFNNHHSVFPTVTRTNAASMVTGRYPGGHGLTANTLVVREFDPYHAFSALEPALVQVARKTGAVLLAPTLADILSQHGQQYVAIGTGTTGNAYVHNPNASICGGATIHPDFCLTYHLHNEIVGRFGPWPGDAIPNTPRLSHAVKILTEYVLPERKPAVSLIWLSEPDHTQHLQEVGSEIARRAVWDADEQFGRLLSWLEERGLAAETDVVALSDHGYSTIASTVDIEALIREAGFPPGGIPGGVVVAPNGGSVLLYTHKRDKVTADRLAAWLMAQSWCGAILASKAVADIPGTLPAALLGCEGPRAPELAMSFGWQSNPNKAGFPGHVYSSSGAPGRGQHGSMSRHETRSVLFARGPSFKSGVVLASPSGNVDLTPTILRILGFPIPEAIDGRPLQEALESGSSHAAVDWSSEAFSAERRAAGGLYRQRITVSRYENTTYVDEGLAWLDPCLRLCRESSMKSGR